MSRKERLSTSYVRVEVDLSAWAMAHDEDYQAKVRRLECERVVADIKRHLDDAHSFVVDEWEGVCSHCGGIWTEDSEAYNGGCCALDQAAHEGAVVVLSP